MQHPHHFMRNIRSPQESVAPMIFSGSRPRSKPRAMSLLCGFGGKKWDLWGCLGGAGKGGRPHSVPFIGLQGWGRRCGSHHSVLVPIGVTSGTQRCLPVHTAAFLPSLLCVGDNGCLSPSGHRGLLSPSGHQSSCPHQDMGGSCPHQDIRAPDPIRTSGAPDPIARFLPPSPLTRPQSDTRFPSLGTLFPHAADTSCQLPPR